MSSADKAAGLRAQAEALEMLADHEADLLEAKAAYAKNPTAETRLAKQRAAGALRALRAEVRANETTVVGGDAFQSGE